jgi:hypothetical protein
MSDIQYTESDRGFKCYTPIKDTYGGQVGVYESSAATQPCIWVSIQQFPRSDGSVDPEAAVHITLEQAERLRDILQAAITNHYQIAADKPETEK